MTNQLKKLFKELKELIVAGYYGSIEIKIHNGKITGVVQHKSHKW